jgi:hypothetical protein
MPKKHGTNPRARKSDRQVRGSLKHKEAEKAKIERRHASEIKRLEKQVENIKQKVKNKYNPFTSKLIQKTMDVKEGRIGKKISRREAMLRLLAIDEWFKKKLELELDNKRISTSKFFKYEEKNLHLIDPETTTKVLVSLLGKNPSILLQKEIIEKRNRLVREIEKAFKGERNRFD